MEPEEEEEEIVPKKKMDSEAWTRKWVFDNPSKLGPSKFDAELIDTEFDGKIPARLTKLEAEQELGMRLE